MDLQAEISLQLNQGYEGQTVEILVESVSKQDSGMLTGRTGGNKLVHFAADPQWIGKLVRVRIEKASSWHLTGVLE
ncbi:tRNA-2-methylthio-N(6)-dimethylallyladenosine synthase [bioreactor metagenome]|uniref:tRNA-2-methylthio-N(6)-dimethylallyladenosine synthase n=1 Tax=bioreactor metagenome TaxID=1076179 RepID=A0A645FZE8_9ZZZZ